MVGDILKEVERKVPYAVIRVAEQFIKDGDQRRMWNMWNMWKRVRKYDLTDVPTPSEVVGLILDLEIDQSEKLKSMINVYIRYWHADDTTGIEIFDH